MVCKIYLSDTNGSNPSQAFWRKQESCLIISDLGGLAEWIKASVLKTDVQKCTMCSNHIASAISCRIGETGLHKRLKIFRLRAMPVRIWHPAPFFFCEIGEIGIHATFRPQCFKHISSNLISRTISRQLNQVEQWSPKSCVVCSIRTLGAKGALVQLVRTGDL